MICLTLHYFALNGLPRCICHYHFNGLLFSSSIKSFKSAMFIILQLKRTTDVNTNFYLTDKHNKMTAKNSFRFHRYSHHATLKVAGRYKNQHTIN